jgi:hypothetical protein
MVPGLYPTEIQARINKCTSKMKVLKVNILTNDEKRDT